MTWEIFSSELKILEGSLRRKILLLLDNASSHGDEDEVKALGLKYVTVHFLPPNTTSRLQPVDAGIILNFKKEYKKRFMKLLLTL